MEIMNVIRHRTSYITLSWLSFSMFLKVSLNSHWFSRISSSNLENPWAIHKYLHWYFIHIYRQTFHVDLSRICSRVRFDLSLLRPWPRRTNVPKPSPRNYSCWRLSMRSNHATSWMAKLQHISYTKRMVTQSWSLWIPRLHQTTYSGYLCCRNALRSAKGRSKSAQSRFMARLDLHQIFEFANNQYRQQG